MASRYAPHPSIAHVRASLRNLQERTGMSVHEWVERVKAEGPPGEKERREWLKAEHGMGTNYAWWIAERAEGRGWEDDDPDRYLAKAEEYVETQYAGAKSALRPLFEALLDLGLSQGPDAKACPCQTIVPLYRNHVFAEIKPTTRTRVDLGLALGELPVTGRLVDTGGRAKKNRITHRIPLASVGEVDDEVRRWLRTAYERDA